VRVKCPHADSRSLNLARIQLNFAQSDSLWGSQAELAYTDQFGVVESSKPPTDRDLKPVADKKHDEEDEEEEGAHDITLCCGAEKGRMRAPHRMRVRGECGAQDDVECYKCTGSNECALDEYAWRSSWQCVCRTLPNRCDKIFAACFQMGAQAPNGACN
jgi:hypothetical protein